MNPIVQLVLIALAIVSFITAFVLRLLKFKTVGNWVEIIGIGLFVAFASQYAYWFGNFLKIDTRGFVEISLFLFSIVLAVYKFVMFFIFPKR